MYYVVTELLMWRYFFANRHIYFWGGGQLNEYLSDSAITNDKLADSLLGKLLYIHKCVASARTFINRILALFRQNLPDRCIGLTEEFQKDLNWFLLILPNLMASPISKSQVYQVITHFM